MVVLPNLLALTFRKKMAFEIKGLTLSRGKQRILNALALRLEPGELLGLLGANGAGKSSLLSAMAGELLTQSDLISIDDVALASLDAIGQARLRAVLPQTPALSFDFSVNEVVEMGAYPFQEASAEQVQEWMLFALQAADVCDLRDRRYVQLSGGEQQRVQFARVLVQCRAILCYRRQAYLLLDEPLTSLDPRHQVHLMCTIQELAHKHQLGVLIIVHDLNLAARWCDRIALLAEHEIAAVGTPQEVLTQKNLAKVFGMNLLVIDHPIAPGKLLVVGA